MRFEDVPLSRLIDPTPKQRECIEATDRHRFVLYGGAAGGGKSYMLRWWLVRQLIRRFEKTGIRGLRAGLFSVDYPTLQDRQLAKIEREFPEWLGKTRRTEKEGLCFFVQPEFGGGRIALRNLADPASYKSSEFCDIAVEELTESARDVFEDLVLFRLRAPGIERPGFLAATNPTGAGLQWVKALWIDRKFPAELQHLKHEFCFVPAMLGDNPHLGPEYGAALRGLPEKKRRALLEGDWTVPEGQYFTNFERTERAVHPSVLGQVVQPWWNRWISQDWGFRHHSPVHWHAAGNVLPEQARLLGRNWDTPRHCVFTYREHVQSLAETGESEIDLGRTIRARSAEEKVSRWILSSDAFGQKTSQNTAAQLLTQGVGQGFVQPMAANMTPGSRVVGWRLLYSLIQEDRWFLSEMCPEALAAIPAAEYDADKGGEDVLKTDHLYDDVLDELRYGLADMLGSTAKPFALAKAEAVSEVLKQHGPTMANIENLRWQAKGGKKRWSRQYS